MIFDFGCRWKTGRRGSAQELCVTAARFTPEVLSAFVSQLFFLWLLLLFATASFNRGWHKIIRVHTHLEIPIAQAFLVDDGSYRCLLLSGLLDSYSLTPGLGKTAGLSGSWTASSAT